MSIANLTRYTMVIRRDHEGFAIPALKVRQQGEVVKFEDIEASLNSQQQLKQVIALLRNNHKNYLDNENGCTFRACLNVIEQRACV